MREIHSYTSSSNRGGRVKKKKEKTKGHMVKFKKNRDYNDIEKVDKMDCE